MVSRALFQGLMVLVVTSVSLSGASEAGVQSADADLMLAQEYIKQAEHGLTLLKPGDIATFSWINTRARKTRERLQASSSDEHPDYAEILERWDQVRLSLLKIAGQWEQTSALSPSNSAAGGKSPESYGLFLLRTETGDAYEEIRALPVSAFQEDAIYAYYVEKVRSIESQLGAFEQEAKAWNLDKQLQEMHTILSVVRSDSLPASLMQKYLPAHHPALQISAGPLAYAEWASNMVYLAGAALREDIETVERALLTGQLRHEDKQAFYTWVCNVWIKDVESQIAKTTQRIDQRVVHALDLAGTILAFPEEPDSETLARLREHYPSSRAQFQDGIVAIEVALAYDSALQRAHAPDRKRQREMLKKAKQRLEQLQRR